MGQGELDIGDWRVEPRRNRLTRGGLAVSIEPKMMDVLVFLAEHAGEVVSKDAIAGAAWAGTFVSESVITRAIAGLRKALGDDARAPRYVETIAKRGYRLVVAPSFASTAVGTSAVATPQPRRGTSGSPVGQWVCGGGFFGRDEELDEILHGPRNLLWLLGTRAIGKTSTLRQLEHLTAGSTGTVPLFWDLQGIDDVAELHTDFAAVLAAAQGRFAALGLDLAEVAGEDLFASLRRLATILARRGGRLLLLIDEAEEIVQLGRKSSSLLRKLRRALQTQDGLRTVLAASGGLWQLAEQRDDTSPFLHGLAPPIVLGSLDDAAARRLASSTPDDGGTAAEIARRSGNHPYLIQMLRRRLAELGDLDLAAETVAADPTVGFLFAVDFELLAETERQTLLALALGAGNDPPDEPGAVGRLLHLARLGLVRRDGQRFEIASPIRARWLRERPEAAVQKL